MMDPLEIGTRLGRLEAGQRAYADDVREVREAVGRIESNVSALLVRDAERRGRAVFLRGLPAAIWLTVAGAVAGATGWLFHIALPVLH